MSDDPTWIISGSETFFSCRPSTVHFIWQYKEKKYFIYMRQFDTKRPITLRLLYQHNAPRRLLSLLFVITLAAYSAKAIVSPDANYNAAYQHQHLYYQPVIKTGKILYQLLHGWHGRMMNPASLFRWKIDYVLMVIFRDLALLCFY